MSVPLSTAASIAVSAPMNMAASTAAEAIDGLTRAPETDAHCQLTGDVERHMLELDSASRPSTRGRVPLRLDPLAVRGEAEGQFMIAEGW